MANESVPIASAQASALSGSKHDLWITEKSVLTIAIDRQCADFPPDSKQCFRLNLMIQGLARAAKALIFQAENDEKSDHDFTVQPICDIADAIVLLSQLSEAVRIESSEVQS